MSCKNITDFLGGNFVSNFISSISGAGIGAWLAFKYNLKQKSILDEENTKAQGNFALFALIQQFNELINIEKELSPYRSEPNRDKAWIELKSITMFTQLPELNTQDLGWLLLKTDPNLLPRMTAVQNGLFTIRGIINKRNAIKNESNIKIHNTLSSVAMPTAFTENGEITIGAINSILGSKTIVELQSITAALFEQTTICIHEYIDVMNNLRHALLASWPNTRFIKLEPITELEARLGFRLPTPM